MRVLRAVINQGWYPILIVTLAVIGVVFEWGIWIITPLLGVILVVSLVVTARGAKKRKLKLSFLRLWHLASYLNHRFMGNSSLSIFAIIDNLFNIDNPKLWEWARTSDLSQRVFNSWCNSFISRVESDISNGRFDVHLHIYLNEPWLINSHYYELIEQSHELAEKLEIPQETIGLHNRFMVEYNTFVQDFRDNISQLKRVAETAIEPPNVKFVQGLAVVE